MWWPGGASSWTEAHSAAGVTQPGAAWAVAEGECDGSSGSDTYLLIANTSSNADSVRVTLFFEDGGTARREFQVEADTRFNVAISHEFPESRGRRFGALVESAGGAPLVVEASLYRDAGGTTWAAGSSTVATRVR